MRVDGYHGHAWLYPGSPAATQQYRGLGMQDHGGAGLWIEVIVPGGIQLT